ncbi:hypothetical protein ACWD01_10895 [Streptomyces sp. NPDC002835]
MFAAAGIAVLATGAALRGLPYDAVALVCSGAIGLGLPCVVITAMTAVQREAPAAWVGRTAATASALLFVPNAVAPAVGAGLVAVADVRVLPAVVGAVGVASALVLGAGRTAAPAPTEAERGPLPGDRVWRARGYDRADPSSARSASEARPAW